MTAALARDKAAIVAAPQPCTRAGFVPGVTTVILTFDEEIHIARAIASAQAFSREVLVVDSFSRDRTVEIARGMGARVVQNPWINYARQFRFALEECGIATEWVLRLDADEHIGADLAATLQRTLPQLPLEVAGVVLNRRHVFMGRWIRHGGRYPLQLLRLWRNGLGEVEDRWMDEHVRLREGRSIEIAGDFADICERDMAFFVTKHNGYATREAIDVLGRKYALFDQASTLDEGSGAQARAKRFVKERIYNRLPFAVGPLAYFLFRYVFQLGFLDGRAGLVYHVMQGFWYRFLVDVRVLELERAVRTCTTREARLAALRDATGLKL
jgi:glycosyltransferase involved in cell wall biosynthesis